jgi:heterodisulfide reductase subunit C
MEVIRVHYDKDEVSKKTKTSEVCFKCSACSKYCPITMYVDKYNLADSFIVHLFTEADEEAWKIRAKDVWMCAVCEKCVTICPQDRDPTIVFNNLKQRSYQEGLAPENIYQMVKQLVHTGMAYPVNASLNARRTRQGLGEIKENPKMVGDLAAIAKSTGLKLQGE